MELAELSVSAFVIIFLAIAVGSIWKGVTGVGLPVIAVPFMAGFLGVERAVIVLVLPTLVSNAMIVWGFRSEAAVLRQIWPMLAAGIAGGVLGSWILAESSDRLLIILLATWLGIYLLAYVARRQPRVPARWAHYLSGPIGLAAGTCQGATGISAPVVATYLYSLSLPRRAYVFSITCGFTTFSIAQLFALDQLGVFTPARLSEGVLATLPVLVFIPLGMRLAERLSQELFEKALIGIFVIMEIRLAWIAVTGG